MAPAHVATVVEALQAVLPVRSGALEFKLVSHAEDPRDCEVGVKVTFEVVLYEDDGSIADIIQQEVLVIAVAHCSDRARATAYLRGWALALPAVAEHLGIERPFPHDLIFREILDDTGLVHEADFEAAFRDPERMRALARARVDAEIAEEFVHLREKLEAHLGPDEPRVAAVMAFAQRPSIEVDVDYFAPPDGPLGTSRLGGLPDLPPDVPWPRFREEPLDFLGQIDLASLHASMGAAAAALPATGWLSFFCALRYQGCPDPDDPACRGGGRVLYFDGARERLTRRSLPDGILELPAREAECRLRRPALPYPLTPFYSLLQEFPSAANPYKAAFDAYAFLGDFVQPDLGRTHDVAHQRPRDRLLGYADPFGVVDPYLQCARHAHGVPSEELWTRATIERAAEWTLLFQADSQPDAGVMLGNLGVIWFFIRAEDLLARRFDRVWTVRRSH
jgi:uncharacterized protein YwqG